MRTLTGGVILLAALGCAAVWLGQPAVSQHAWDVSLAQHEQRAAQLDMKRTRRDAFAAYLEQLYQPLASGAISLEKARDQLVAYSEAFYPEYLQYLRPTEMGATLEEKVARNLVRHFQTARQTTPNAYRPALVQKLEEELAAVALAAQQTEIRYTNR